jgi:hypothetical protein
MKKALTRQSATAMTRRETKFAFWLDGLKLGLPNAPFWTDFICVIMIIINGFGCRSITENMTITIFMTMTNGKFT